MKTDQNQLKLRLRQFAQQADRGGYAVPGRFVTGEERSAAIHEARECGVQVSFDGGWTDAERVQCCFHPPGEEPYFTCQWVRIEWNSKFGHCEHRDLMGSLMALGIDRSYFGDLIAEDGTAWLCTLPETAVRLPSEWQQAGRTSIRVSIPDEPPVLHPPEGVFLRDTVASLRLDSILQSGMRISRSKAADLIRQGAVQLDHLPEERTDRQLKEGSLLSVRGFGRIRLKEVGAPTRKDRLPILLEVFSSC